MSEAVNLKRARIIEVGAPEQNGILIRTKPGDPFTRIGGVEEGEVEADETHRKFYEDALSRLTDRMTVLAEFPLTLADLLPKGCTEFRFRNTFGALRVAWHDGNRWCTGDDDFDDLRELQDLVHVDLNTVIPLQVSDQYVEERR